MSLSADRWSEALDAWRIPDRILRDAPESPWSFPTELFQRRADAAIGTVSTPSAERAWEALDQAGRRRVVIELTEQHPVRHLNPLWLRFHGLRRPEGPTADDVVGILEEMDYHPQVERWQAVHDDDLLSASERHAIIMRHLCLPIEREAEVAAALAELPDAPARRVTLWWTPRASPA